VEHESLLQTMAQVAATFGGLAAVISAIRQDVNREFDHPFIVRDVVEISIIATILSLIPFLPTGFGLDESLSYRICCVAALLVGGTGFGLSLRRGWHVWQGRPALLAGTLVITAGLWVLLIGAASGFVGRPDMVYVASMLVLLVQAGIMFITVLTPTSEKNPS
jgi:hypothetical protein